MTADRKDDATMTQDEAEQVAQFAGWSQEDIELTVALMNAMAEAIVANTVGKGKPMVSVDVLHVAIGMVLERSFEMMPNNRSRAYYFNQFVTGLANRIEAIVVAHHVPDGATMQ